MPNTDLPIAETPEDNELQAAGSGGSTPPSNHRSAPALAAKLGLHRFSGLYVGALIIIVFSLVAPHTFAQYSTVRIVANAQAFTTMVALASLVPLICGGFDFSVAQMLGFSAIVAGLLQQQGFGAIPSVLLTLVAALLVGCTNAFIVIRLRVSAFIGTLAMTSVLEAIEIWVGKDQDVTSGLSSGLVHFGEWEIPGVGFDTPVICMLVMAVVLWYVLSRMPIGRALYATGDNPEAAKLSGLRVNRLVAGSFVVSAMLAGIAGIMYVAQVGGAYQATGPEYLLPAFSAVFLGATQIVPGRFNVVGTLVAVYVLAAGLQGLELTISAPVFLRLPEPSG